MLLTPLNQIFTSFKSFCVCEKLNFCLRQADHKKAAKETTDLSLKVLLEATVNTAAESQHPQLTHEVSCPGSPQNKLARCFLKT